MKDFDLTGLRYAEYIANLFSESTKLDCSSKIFLRRFLHSTLLKEIDRVHKEIMSLDYVSDLERITIEFGETNYGKDKYSKDTLFWMGYLLAYISYTRDERLSFVMSKINYSVLPPLYFSYHTQSLEWQVDNILETLKLDKNIFDKNYRLKQALREIYKK